jgi:MFS family permease
LRVTSAPLSPRSVFRQKHFRILWLAQFVSVFGDFLALFGVISLITFRLHGTAVDITTVIVAYMLPMAVVSPVAGVLVDRWNVKRVMIASDLIRAVLALLLVFTQDVRHIALIFASLAVVASFFAPSQAVTLRALVPAEDLLAANAMLSQAFYLVRIVSPALAGALVAWLTEKACFYLDAGSFLFSAAMISMLPLARARAAGGSIKSLVSEFIEGNRFIFTHQMLTFAFFAMVSTMLVFSAFSPLVSIYIRDVLGAGTFTYGIVSAMVGVGLMVGTQLVQRASRGRPTSHVILGGLLGVGVGAALLGAFRSVPSAAGGTLVIGTAVAFVIVPAQTLTQRETPHELIGRVSSTFLSLNTLAQVPGMLASGALAELLGIRPLFVACGAALALLAAAGWLWLRPRV